jgi:UDP-N-acetyl-D-glucosamine dehydrogenase
MKVVIIGQGYVGLSLAMAVAAKHHVVGVDYNASLVGQLNSGISHIEGVDSQVVAKAVKEKRYLASQSFAEIAGADVVVIAVPTPLDQARNPDMSHLESACKAIGENAVGSLLVINESTSYPGTLRGFIKPAIEKASRVSVDHRYAVSPERVDPGNEKYSQKNTPRLVAGLTEEASYEASEFYSGFCDEIVEVASPEVAEAAKLFENTFRQVNIALVNEFAQISHALGISVHEVLEAADTKPFGFMKFSPSAGVGGHCIPVDPTYLASAAESVGASAAFIKLANEVNRGMAEYVVNRVVADHGGSLQGKSVLVVGVSYKKDVADVRESAAQLVIEHLRNRGAVVSWHDDVVGSWSGEVSAPLMGADIAVVVTRHSSVSDRAIIDSAPYVFDTTGTVAGARGL